MNPWRQFLALLPRSTLEVVEVISHNADGTSTVEYPNGAQVRVRGQLVAVASFAFIKDGEIRGEAPAITPIVLDV